MQQHKVLQIGVRAVFVLVACAASFAVDPPAAKELNLYNFSGNDGFVPAGALTFAGNGNFYGATFFGGTADRGIVFELSRTASGTQETVLHNFQGGSSDVQNPSGRLLLTADGRIFGTATGAGLGYGAVYELIPSGGTWVYTILHFFGTGETPIDAGVIIDKTGNLYGETSGGGQFGYGTIYELQSTSTGYKYVRLYSFDQNAGSFPTGGLIFDRAGNLYGTTINGGPNLLGTVFELKRKSNGTWTEDMLYTFQNSSDGVSPEGDLVFDSSGNLFGTTAYGGDQACANDIGCGEVYELSPSGGVWTKTTLHTFTDTPDARAPNAGLAIDRSGNLFGTTNDGGTAGTGSLFEISPTSSGWTETVLYSFTDGVDGGFVTSPVTLDLEGNIFGVTASGGRGGDGVAFAFMGLDAK
jgi:uncharacterized repeat protein (TIGR03803 family)